MYATIHTHSMSYICNYSYLNYCVYMLFILLNTLPMLFYPPHILFANDKGGEIIAYQLVIGKNLISTSYKYPYQLLIVTGGAKRYIFTNH